MPRHRTPQSGCCPARRSSKEDHCGQKQRRPEEEDKRVEKSDTETLSLGTNHSCWRHMPSMAFSRSTARGSVPRNLMFQALESASLAPRTAHSFGHRRIGTAIDRTPRLKGNRVSLAQHAAALLLADQRSPFASSLLARLTPHLRSAPRFSRCSPAHRHQSGAPGGRRGRCRALALLLPWPSDSQLGRFLAFCRSLPGWWRQVSR